MDRRHLLKSLASLVAAPVLVKGQEVGKQFALDPQAKYVVFADMDMVDCHELACAPSAIPVGTVIFPVLVPRGKTLDQAIRIYEIK